METILVTLEYPPDRGGVATYLEGEVHAAEDPVRIVRGQEHFWEKWPCWLPLLWRVRPKRGDAVWVSHVLPIGYVALVWKKLFGIQYRVYVHGLDLVLPKRSVWKAFWVRRILLPADEIVANSKATAGLLDYYNIPPERARISYPKIKKINPEDYGAAGEALRIKHHLNGKTVVLAISRLVKRKGINLVIYALKEVWKKMPDLTYVVVGEGSEARELKLLVGGNPRVIFTGAVSEEEKYAWLSTCNCFILTPVDDPLDFEGYGIVYKEAQAFGKPVIGSRVGGVPEAIGENGTLVEPGNIREITEAIIKTVGQNTNNQTSNTKKTPNNQ
ncbi:MAG: glycosyltransferase family 4 protein [Parcubacteria group bacterium]|nr:glycosyltransferase family 4 protein [Parcubacteria group bacterium]